MTFNHTTRCIILMVHGSRDPQWRAPFEELQKKLAEKLGSQSVALAYMEFTTPTLNQVIEDKYKQGLRDFIVFPLFMAAGAHVSQDIPVQTDEARKLYDDITVTVTPPAGEDEAMKALMIEMATRHFNSFQ